MLEPRTLKVLAVLAVLYALACLPAVLQLGFLEPASSWFILLPFFTSHLLQKLGVPGLLEHGGHCGWGWCAPTPLGWAVTALAWLAFAWLLAWGLARVKFDRAKHARPGL